MRRSELDGRRGIEVCLVMMRVLVLPANAQTDRKSRQEIFVLFRAFVNEREERRLAAVQKRPLLRGEDHERLNGLPVVDDGLHDDQAAGVHDQIRKSLILGQIDLPDSSGGNSRITENNESVCAPSSLKNVNGLVAAADIRNQERCRPEAAKCHREVCPHTERKTASVAYRKHIDSRGCAERVDVKSCRVRRGTIRCLRSDKNGLLTSREIEQVAP